MLKFDFTKQEVDNIKSKIYLNELQERIFEYRLKEYSITKMAMLENCSESTISREIKKIKRKIMKTL
jgi:IS30 family transposase